MGNLLIIEKNNYFNIDKIICVTPPEYGLKTKDNIIDTEGFIFSDNGKNEVKDKISFAFGKEFFKNIEDKLLKHSNFIKLSSGAIININYIISFMGGGFYSRLKDYKTGTSGVKEKQGLIIYEGKLFLIDENINFYSIRCYNKIINNKVKDLTLLTSEDIQNLVKKMG